MQLLHSRFVVAFDDQFRDALDGVARARGWPTTGEPGRLGALVRRLSDAYNAGAAPAAPLPRGHDALAARLLFSFPRDVPKGAGAVRELVAGQALRMPEGRALRVLDVGAGLGATSRGVVRALAAAGATGTVAIDALDADGEALDLAAAIARARPDESGLHVELRTVRAQAGTVPPGPYDLVVLGQVLSELDRGAADRVARHAALVRALAARVDPAGSIVIVEPALRERTRHLHELRDALVAAAGPALNVFAPCVDDAPCPMLRAGDGWCHEDLDVDLPDWLVPTARAAGLRWQGLTFSYLVLRLDGRRQPRGGVVPASPLRVVSAPLVSKGKRELFVCGPVPGSDGAAHVKVMRLDRQATAANAAWGDAARGDLLEISPRPTKERPRVDASTVVVRLSADGVPPQDR